MYCVFHHISGHLPRQIWFWKISTKTWASVRPPPPLLGRMPNFFQKRILKAPLSCQNLLWEGKWLHFTISYISISSYAWVEAPEKSVHVNIGGIWDGFDPFLVRVDVKAKDLRLWWGKCYQHQNTQCILWPSSTAKIAKAQNLLFGWNWKVVVQLWPLILIHGAPPNLEPYI